jgi:hypothetical protein
VCARTTSLDTSPTWTTAQQASEVIYHTCRYDDKRFFIRLRHALGNLDPDTRLSCKAVRSTQAVLGVT